MFGLPFGFLGAQGISSPLAIPNCDWWLDSELGVTVVSGKVSNWANQGSGGSNLDGGQSTSGIRPVYTASGGANNHAYLTFDGTDRLDVAHGMTGSGARTFVFVFKCDTLPHTGFSMLSAGSLTGTYETIVDLSTYKDISVVSGWIAGGTMFGYDFSLGTSATHYLLHTWDGVSPSTGSSYASMMDGTAKTILTSGAYGIATGGAIGARPDATFGFVGKLYAMMSWSRVISAPEQALVKAYCQGRWTL